MQSIVKGTLAATVAVSGTFTASYPADKTPGHFKLAMGHKLALGQGAFLSFPEDFNLTFNAVGSGITVTNVSGSIWPANMDYILELQELGEVLEYSDGFGAVPNVTDANVVHVSLGSPVVGAVNAVMTTAQMAAAGLTTSAAGVEKLGAVGTVTLDVPRGVSITSAAAGDGSGFSAKITGLDVFGKAMSETITFNGAATVAGLKAFKKVTSVKMIHASATDLTGAVSVGTTNVLGIPLFLPAAGYILKELQDGAAATAGTTVAGIRTADGSTAVTGDVRGTYLPNAAPDGGKAYTLIMLAEKNNRGIAQFAG